MTSIFSKLCISLMVSAGFFACNPKLTPTNSTPSVVIDGDDAEWNRDQYQRVKEIGLVYSIAEDEKSVKVLVKAMDQQTLKKLGLLGLIIWFDGKGKSRKELGIKYPLGVMGSGMFQNLMSQRDNLKNFDRSQLEGKGLEMLEAHPANQIGLIGIFDDTDEVYQYPIDALNIPIEVSRRIVSREELIAEYSIPKTLIKKGKKKVLSVGFEIEGINVQEMVQQQMANRGGRFARAGGAGRMAGRRMGRGGMNPKMRELQELNQPMMNWSRFEWTW